MTKPVEINIRKTAAENRIAAIKAGRHIYDGRKCPRHKITQRYTRNHCCIRCHIECAERAKERRKMQYSKNADAVTAANFNPKPLKPWPDMAFEDDITHDHIGSRTVTHYTPYNSVRGSSMAEIE